MTLFNNNIVYLLIRHCCVSRKSCCHRKKMQTDIFFIKEGKGEMFANGQRINFEGGTYGTLLVADKIDFKFTENNSRSSISHISTTNWRIFLQASQCLNNSATLESRLLSPISYIKRIIRHARDPKQNLSLSHSSKEEGSREPDNLWISRTYRRNVPSDSVFLTSRWRPPPPHITYVASSFLTCTFVFWLRSMISISLFS